MFEIKGSFVQLSLDVQRYTRTLDEAMQVQLRQAAREWLRAVILRVPVWAGTSRGSLRPLGSYLRVAVPISPRVGPTATRGPSVGAGQSDFEFSSPRKGVYQFTFDEQVLHYRLNEFFDMSGFLPLLTPTPWASFKAGETAFTRYVNDVLPKRLPRPEQFLVQKRISFK